MAANVEMEQLVALCKRRGFVFPASEIYGGINGFWDYGPLGTQLKNNIRDGGGRTHSAQQNKAAANCEGYEDIET